MDNSIFVVEFSYRTHPLYSLSHNKVFPTQFCVTELSHFCNSESTICRDRQSTDLRKIIDFSFHISDKSCLWNLLHLCLCNSSNYNGYNVPGSWKKEMYTSYNCCDINQLYACFFLPSSILCLAQETFHSEISLYLWTTSPRWDYSSHHGCLKMKTQLSLFCFYSAD